MKNTWIKSAAMATIVVCAASVSAQSSGPSGFSPRVGVFLPTESVGSGTWFALGLDYKLNAMPATGMGNGTTGYWGLSADYYTFGPDSNVPVVLNFNLRQNQFVLSIGAGIDFYNIPDFGGNSGTGFGAQAAVSYDLSAGALPIFLQAKYFLASRSELRGFGLYLGVRF